MLSVISKKKFGMLENGKEVFLYTLKNSELEVEITDFGAAIKSIKVKDKNDKSTDVVLGYDTLHDYAVGDKYLGATVGRSANRIENGVIKLDGNIYRLSQNDSKNHIHGGFKGFNKKVWNAEKLENGIKFSCFSPDGEEGYPGNLTSEVYYTLDKNALCIKFMAKTDKDTVYNPTNHTYFNLDGLPTADVLNQFIKIYADFYTENDLNSLPNGKILPVDNTPMDFREFKPVVKDLDSNFNQIKYGNGYDNNWVIKDYDGSLRLAAEAYSEKSGIKLDVLTDLCGIQFYSGNYLDSSLKGKNDSKIDKHYGFCLECQYFPNAFMHENFLKPILKAGEIFNKNIIYKFCLV